MFKFVHAADLHLDSPLRGLERYEGAPVHEMRQATRRALANLVGLAIEEKVDKALEKTFGALKARPTQKPVAPRRTANA